MSVAQQRLVASLLQAREQATLIEPPSATADGLSLGDAYRVAAAAQARLQAAGDRPRGWKIGFTNRSIWARYNVDRPIWGRVWDSTLTLLDGTEAKVSLAGMVQPRIEPEIVFGLASTPEPGMDAEALRHCIAWVAHGIEIVHTHYAGWKFGAVADTVADFGLHGRLLVGPRVPVADWPTLGRDLAALRLTLWHDGKRIDAGQGGVVLDGPVSALAEWLRAMHAQGIGACAAAGDVVTTGTLTDAWPVAAGEVWHTETDDSRLVGLRLRFAP